MLKYISLDIETTGLDPDRHQVLEIGLQPDNLELDEIPLHLATRIVIVRNNLYIETHLCEMHQELIKEIDEQRARLEDDDGYVVEISEEGITTVYTWPEKLQDALLDTFGRYHNSGEYQEKFSTKGGKFVLAGKNIQVFDLPFILQTIPMYYDQISARIHRRVLDPGPMYTESFDELPPSLDECADRAGLKEVSDHTAISDARLVCKLIRHKLTSQDGVPAEM